MSKKKTKGFSHKEFIQLFGFATNDDLVKADALLFIQGDGLSRPELAAELYKKGLAPKVVVTGEIKRKPSKKESRIESALKVFRKLSVPERDIILEPNSINTREQAVETMKLAIAHNWQSLILAVPLYHKPRAYATFIRAMKEANIKIRIISYPVRGLSWFEKTREGTRYDLLGKELKKINTYTAKGHVAPFREVLAYERWKESTKPNIQEI